jgi:hypothetical protein
MFQQSNLKSFLASGKPVRSTTFDGLTGAVIMTGAEDYLETKSNFEESKDCSMVETGSKTLVGLAYSF